MMVSDVKQRMLGLDEILNELKFGQAASAADFITEVDLPLSDAWVKAVLLNALRRIDMLERQLVAERSA